MRPDHIRDWEHIINVTDSNPKVALRRGHGAGDNVRAALAELGGLAQYIERGQHVLIKPNLSVPLAHNTGATTNPEVVVTLIESALEAGAGLVTVGESSVCGFDAGRVMDELRLTAVFRSAGARVVNLDDPDTEILEIPVPAGQILNRLRVFRPALECDFLISVPVLKTHIYTTVSLGMKNLKGTLPDEQKKFFHRIGVRGKRKGGAELDCCIAEMMMVHHPDFTVIDGMTGQEGYKPGPGICGSPVQMNTIIAGSDYVAVDAVGALVMGMDPGQIEHIKYSSEYGLGEMDIGRISIMGDHLDEIQRDFRPAEPGDLGIDSDIRLIEGGSCSGCSFAVRYLCAGLDQRQLNMLKQHILVVGMDACVKPASDSEQHLYIGNCAGSSVSDESRKISGCPPPLFYLKQKLF